MTDFTTPETLPAAVEEIEQLRTLVRKLSGGVSWWAALSYVDGAHGQPSRWTPTEQSVLHRAGL